VPRKCDDPLLLGAGERGIAKRRVSTGLTPAASQRPVRGELSDTPDRPLMADQRRPTGSASREDSGATALEVRGRLTTAKDAREVPSTGRVHPSQRADAHLGVRNAPAVVISKPSSCADRETYSGLGALVALSGEPVR